jgi:hypothetical protein
MRNNFSKSWLTATATVVFVFALVSRNIRVSHDTLKIMEPERINRLPVRLERLAASPPPRNESSNATSNVDHAAPNNRTVLVDEGDYIYSKKFFTVAWDTAPIVCEEYKLIFFAVAKVGCTTWKQLFRRIKGFGDWRRQETDVPHNPTKNGLTYLWDYSIEDANRLLMDPNYTRAIFLRDPKERFLSAFLNKAIQDPGFLRNKCCRDTGDCVKKAQTLEGFLNLTETCKDSHWTPQYDRMEPKYWPQINFVGRFDNLQDDAERLLRKVGAWDEYGTNGWGEERNLTIFARSATPNIHSTGAKDKASKWFTPELENRIEQRFATDYANIFSDP